MEATTEQKRKGFPVSRGAAEQDSSAAASCFLATSILHSYQSAAGSSAPEPSDSFDSWKLHALSHQHQINYNYYMINNSAHVQLTRRDKCRFDDHGLMFDHTHIIVLYDTLQYNCTVIMSGTLERKEKNQKRNVLLVPEENSLVLLIVGSDIASVMTSRA